MGLAYSRGPISKLHAGNEIISSQSDIPKAPTGRLPRSMTLPPCGLEETTTREDKPGDATTHDLSRRAQVIEGRCDSRSNAGREGVA